MASSPKTTPAPPTPELPNPAQREVGTRWLMLYGDHPDKAFVAAAVWRMMWLARHEPNAPELSGYRAECATHE